MNNLKSIRYEHITQYHSNCSPALLAQALPLFEGLAGLHMGKGDAFEARKAENFIRGILETNDYPTGDLT